MHIVIFGAGGVGGYFGGRLAYSGERVTFISRGEHLRALQESGLYVDSVNGNFHIPQVVATDDPAQVSDVDAILLCVKTWHIPSAARVALPMFGTNTFIVPLENGIDAPTLLTAIVTPDRVLGGLCRIASRILAPGHIQHSGIEPYIAFGELDNRSSVRTQNLLLCFTRAGIQAEIPPDILMAMWKKFLFISAVSGMGAITRVPADQFRAHPETRRMLEATLQECYAVSIAHGIHLPQSSVAETLAYIDTLPTGTIASMQRDIMTGSPSELEAQSGTIVRLGRLYNIPTPVNEFIYSSLLPQETLARSRMKD